MSHERSIERILRELAGMQNRSITDAYALDLWTRYMRAGGLSKYTIKARTGAIRRLGDFLNPGGDRPRAVLDATSDQLVEWQASRDDLDTKSLAVYIGHYVAFYRWCIRPARILTESPAEDLIRPSVKPGLPRPIPEDDLRYALDACTEQRLRVWMVLGAYAGLRGIDVSLLDRDDVLTDYDLPRLRVRGKGGYEDVIDIGHEVVRVLDPYRGRRGAMFVDEDGKRVEPDDVYRAVNKYLARLGLDYTFHQLRHRYGTRLYWLTRDIRYVQRQMRHRSVATTEVYALIPTDKGEKSMRALDAELAERPRGRSHAPQASMQTLDAELAGHACLADELASEPTPELWVPPAPPEPRRSAIRLPSLPSFSG